MDPKELELIRHFLSTISYRAEKALEKAPENFPDLQLRDGVRTPKEIMHHINELIIRTKARVLNRDLNSIVVEPLGWEDEVNRLFFSVNELDNAVVEHQDNIDPELARRLLQGPLADTMTHIGQLAMLRRVAGSPIIAENFMGADIGAGKIKKKK
ncbi:MAG: hypothetical protein KDC73_05615 [Ignavibacteriae bacterium]|nr:hypothetical protein [Ignavibacteriota bacterium]MCB9243797.1 hypothetical protein [Ignavibacteriales bacterium]